MSENNLSEAIGVDPAAVEALARANIRTLQELSGADPEAAAMASGIPVDRIREWQQKARRAGAKPSMNPVAKGWLVGVIAVVIAVLLGWALMAIGSNRIKQAEQVRVAAESRLNVAVSFAAGAAVDDLRQARLALHNRNWGSAQTTLSRVEDTVTFLKQIAPDKSKVEMNQVGDQLTELQKAANEQSKDVMERVDALEAALDALAQGERE
ncbi:MAG TPA: hypothetical protein VMY87_04925 [Armatimonadota bacterium]|nr:hypothetical protein [Armatimonadota bacterium]